MLWPVWNQAAGGLRAVSWSSVLPYLIALLAAALLPVKRRSFYPVVSLALALLWAWLAMAALKSSSPWWAALAGLGCVIFLVLMASGKLEYGARNGPWAVTGTAFLVYSLLISPLLGRASQLFGSSAFLGHLSDWFGHSVFGAPFSPVLFTCGVLFFALEPIAAVAFAVPLFWALLGGPGAASGRVELTGLEVALVAGVLFLLQAPEVRRGDTRLSPGAGYLFANRHRGTFNIGLWALILTTLLCFYLVPTVPPPIVIVHLALLSALGIAVWLIFTGWQSLWFRAVAWWIARALGRIWVWFGYAWQWGIVLLAAAALWAILTFPRELPPPKTATGNNSTTSAGATDKKAPNPPAGAPASAPAPAAAPPRTAAPPRAAASSTPPTPPRAPALPRTAAAPRATTSSTTPTPPRALASLQTSASQRAAAPPPAPAPPPSTQPGSTDKGAVRSPTAADHARRRAVQLFAAVTLLWLAYHVYRGRKRLVIGSFAAYTDDATLDKLVAGLGPRLKSELARISDLFKVIDEATPSRKSGVIEVIPGVEDVGTILKDASAINFGPLKIPANLLVGLVGQMVSGPRITGALHKVDSDFVLTAELSGGGLSGNWRIDANSLEGPRLLAQTTIQALVVQLAFRVATDLVQIGSPRWRAICAFTDGLRAYRETQRQQGDKAAKLREAERCLIRALADDQQFRQCHFNLGVVYRQLGEHKSAESAFRRALKEDPDNFEACYALAEALATDKQFRKALWFSDAAIGINPSDARAWDLESYALRYGAQEENSHQLSLPGDEVKRRQLKLTLPHGDSAWDAVRAPGEIAVALAWRALCRRALGGPSAALLRDKTTALLCTRNLAVVLGRASRFPRSLQLFRQAAWLAPRDPVLQLYEGRTLFWNGRRSDAAKALHGILADGLPPNDQALLWSVLAQAQARAGLDAACRPSGRLAHIRFLDVAAGASADEISDIVDLSLEAPPDRPATKAQP